MKNWIAGAVIAAGLIGSVQAEAEYTVAGSAQSKAEFSAWAQAWYQRVGEAQQGTRLNDFMLRRAYFSLKGERGPHLGFFAHLAADRVGQQGLDDPGVGLGSGIALRDAWVSLNLGEVLKVQLGRMYVPLTRNYGTTSTKAMLTTDLPFLQGGVRGGIFYTNKVGRDDGLTLWGQPFKGRLQYRLMVAEGIEGAKNPDDNPRFAGRLSLNLLEPEVGWFNKGTYLGKKKVLALGAGFDSQQDLALTGAAPQDNLVWTADLFLEYPVGPGTANAEASYSHIANAAQTHNLSALAAGDDARTGYAQAGYLFPRALGPGKVQPYLRYEAIAVDGKPGTGFYSGGFNYFIEGHEAKVSADYSLVNQKEELPARQDHGILTIQVAVGI
jgi:hypothetical protein